MRFWKKSLLVFLFLIILFVDIIVSRFFIANQGHGIYFISLRPGYYWNVDKNKLSEYKQQLSIILGTTPQILVVLSPKLKQTQISTGFQENAVYYAEWKKWHEWNILTIYIDINEFQKYPVEKRDNLLFGFIIGETNTFYKLKRNSVTFTEPFIKL